LACGINLEAMGLRSVVAFITGIGDDTGKRCADLGLDGRYDGFERVAVIGFAGQRLNVGDKLAAFRSVDCRCDGDLDAELVRLVGLALANAFDLRGVKAEDAKIGVRPTERITFSPGAICKSLRKRTSQTCAKTYSSKLWIRTPIHGQPCLRAGSRSPTGRMRGCPTSGYHQLGNTCPALARG
jgi:hypothetical protein